MKKKNSSKLLFISTFTLLFTIGLLLFVYWQTQVNVSEKAKNSSAANTTKIGYTASGDDTVYFNNFVLPNNPTYQQALGDQLVDKARQFRLVNIDSNNPDSTFWIAEVKDHQTRVVNGTADPSNLSIYLLASTVQKELTNVMSSYGAIEDKTCNLESVSTVGNEQNIVTNYRDKNGYIIFSGTCPYGGGDFTSVFKISDGNQVKFQGQFDVPGFAWKGISLSGNATGKLMGVYGVNHPLVAIQFGYDVGTVESLLQVSRIGLFNLQTGVLENLVKFN